jgi:hypothetical protein
MKKLLIIVLMVLAAIALADDDAVETLKARVDRVNPKDQVELCTKIAERQIDALDKAYNEGNIQHAQAALTDIVNYGVKAADTSSQTGKRMKNTEITMRRMTARLEAIRKTLDIDDRPPVGDAIQKLETARTELLNRMFRK